MEWYVEIAIVFGQKVDTQSSRAYGERVDAFYYALSEYLGGATEGGDGGMEFTSSMLCREWGLETFAYLDAQDPEGAAELARRTLSEASERVWGAGTKVEVARVITDEERDRELEAEAGAEL